MIIIRYLLKPSTTVCHLYFSLVLVVGTSDPAKIPDEGAATTCPGADLEATTFIVDEVTGVTKGVWEDF